MTTIYYLTVLEAKGINQDVNRTRLPVVCWDGILLSLCFFLALVAQEFLAYGNIISISASIFRQPPVSLCSLSPYGPVLCDSVLMKISDVKAACFVPILAEVIAATRISFSNKGIFWDARGKDFYKYLPEDSLYTGTRVNLREILSIGSNLKLVVCYINPLI